MMYTPIWDKLSDPFNKYAIFFRNMCEQSEYTDEMPWYISYQSISSVYSLFSVVAIDSALNIQIRSVNQTSRFALRIFQLIGIKIPSNM